MLKCGRESKCGQTWHVKELYSDLFEDWSERFKPTSDAPAASADGYLQFARGFDLSLVKGWYSQENYWDRDQRIGSATVRFPLAKGGYWERLIDRPSRFGKQKARFQPGASYRGVWWCPPSLDLQEVKELWIVEGIFDAIALTHHGIAAVSAMSSNAYLCRLRGIEVVTLTDANELTEGLQTNRRKGSRDNVVSWTPRLREAWNSARAYRTAIWTKKSIPTPAAPERRPAIVAIHGGALVKSSLDSAWQRFITTAIADGVIQAEQRFALHDLKRKGITDSPGTRADKQQASGHRSAAMLDIYDLSVPVVTPSAL